MTNYGPKHTIEDQYGHEVRVDVRGGKVLASVDDHDGLPTYSALTPEQARNFAKQLNAAADEAQQLDPPKREEPASRRSPERSP